MRYSEIFRTFLNLHEDDLLKEKGLRRDSNPDSMIQSHESCSKIDFFSDSISRYTKIVEKR
jgi:hypothetical protein